MTGQDAPMSPLGQGTWLMGEPAARAAETAALRAGVELGMTLIDTAQIYGDGRAEDLVGEALGAARDQLFITSKVHPQNTRGARLAAACEASLRRLRTNRIDLYLLHWRGPGPLAEVVDGMEALKASGRIVHWGVSNFDVADMEALMAAGGEGCAADQVAYNLRVRGVEFDLAPWLLARSILLMAYSPVDKARLLQAPALAQVAARHGVGAATLALAWTLRRPGLVAIPKAASVAHVRENGRALELKLSDDDLAALDAAFPPPVVRTPLVLL